MIPSNLRDIIDTLIANSRQGSLDWKEAPPLAAPRPPVVQPAPPADPRSAGGGSAAGLTEALSAALFGRPESYTVSFPDLTVIVTRMVRAGLGSIRLSVTNQRGEEIAAAASNAGEPDFDVLNELVDAARARARRVDEALDRLRAYLHAGAGVRPGPTGAGRRVAPPPPVVATLPLQGYWMQASAPSGDMDGGGDKLRAFYARMQNLGMRDWVQSASGAAGRATYTVWPSFAQPVPAPQLRVAAEQSGLHVDDLIVP